MGEAHPGADSEQRAGREEARRLAAESGELGATAGRVTGFAEQLLADRGHLIAPDHESAGVQPRNRLRLCERETERAVGGRLSVEVFLRQPRCDRLERESKARQELPAIGGGRGEDQRWEDHWATLNRLRENNGLARNPIFDLERVDTYYTRPMPVPPRKSRM